MNPKRRIPADNPSTSIAGNAKPTELGNESINDETTTVSQGGRVSIAPREILAKRFPGWTQRFWTWVTGIALPGQRPLIIWRPWMRAIALLIQVLVSGAIGISALTHISSSTKESVYERIA